MGGPGSGNRWRYGAKSTTEDYRTLDVRRWAREGILRPGYCASWKWTRNGQVVASIQMQSEYDRVILIYRHRGGGGIWKDEQYPVRIEKTPTQFAEVPIAEFVVDLDAGTLVENPLEEDVSCLRKAVPGSPLRPGSKPGSYAA